MQGEFFGGGGEAHIYTIVLTMRRVDIAKKEIPVPRTQDAIQPVGARHPSTIGWRTCDQCFQ